MNAIIAFLGGVRATIFAALMLVFLGTSVFLHYKHKGYVAQMEAATGRAIAEAQKKEKEWDDALYDIVYKLTEKRLAREKALNDDLACIRSGECKLRARFTCVSKASEAQSGDNGAGEAGIQKADEEFLIRESDHADRVVDKLTACQANLRELTE